MASLNKKARDLVEGPRTRRVAAIHTTDVPGGLALLVDQETGSDPATYCFTLVTPIAAVMLFTFILIRLSLDQKLR